MRTDLRSRGIVVTRAVGVSSVSTHYFPSPSLHRLLRLGHATTVYNNSVECSGQHLHQHNYFSPRLLLLWKHDA